MVNFLVLFLFTFSLLPPLHKALPTQPFLSPVFGFSGDARQAGRSPSAYSMEEPRPGCGLDHAFLEDEPTGSQQLFIKYFFWLKGINELSSTELDWALLNCFPTKVCIFPSSVWAPNNLSIVMAAIGSILIQILFCVCIFTSSQFFVDEFFIHVKLSIRKKVWASGPKANGVFFMTIFVFSPSQKVAPPFVTNAII